jgi:type IV secretory pathway VirB10-like protein
MSNFTYEIDERNLRLQMKDFVIPVKEDAWQKFETFSDTMVSQHRENRLRNFNFSLNRGVVLPSVFGVIIILFSFLLVNFVSIKNPAKISEQKAEVKPVEMVAPEPAAPKIEKTVPVVVPAEIKADPQVVAAAEVKTEEKTPVTAPEVKSETAVVATGTTDASASPDTEEEKAKRKAERRAARAAERQKLREISPTPISDEGDSEVRPD